jgi:hypothetical protein
MFCVSEVEFIICKLCDPSPCKCKALYTHLTFFSVRMNDKTQTLVSLWDINE